MSVDVNLPRDYKPNWPDRCVVCRAEGPGHRTKIWTFAIGWWTIVLLTFGAIFVARVPACPACAKKLHTQRLIRLVVCIFFCVAGVAFAIWLLGNYTGPFRHYLAVGIALVGISPFILYEIVVPLAFDMTCFRKTVDYEFKDEMYALEFEMLNHPNITDDEEPDA